MEGPVILGEPTLVKTGKSANHSTTIKDANARFEPQLRPSRAFI